MRTLLLLFLITSLYCVDELAEARKTIQEPVTIIFQLTVVNKDKKTTETTIIQLPFKLDVWEKDYRPLTLQELRTFRQFGYIKALPVTITIQTI
jgi:hypothetical protein